jgi:hypothetical protein
MGPGPILKETSEYPGLDQSKNAVIFITAFPGPWRGPVHTLTNFLRLTFITITIQQYALFSVRQRKDLERSRFVH